MSQIVVTKKNMYTGEVTASVTLTDAQIRTGNSIPVEIVPGLGANSVTIPTRARVAFKHGTLAFSASFTARFRIGDGSVISAMGNLFVAADQVTQSSAADVEFGGSGGPIDAALFYSVVDGYDLRNTPIYVVLSADTTDGDGAILTVELDYTIWNLAGLI